MTHRVSRFAWIGIALTVSLASTSCSVYMESTRPTPVNLDDYQIGQSRDSVLERLGAPESTAKESDGANCDFYKLYTKGYGAGGKIPIAVVEGAADVVTLGLAEVLLTPAEGVTKNAKHPVAFCYKDNRIARVTTDDGGSNPGSAQASLSTPPAPAAAASSPQPTTPAGDAASGTEPPAMTAGPTTAANNVSHPAQPTPAASDTSSSSTPANSGTHSTPPTSNSPNNPISGQ